MQLSKTHDDQATLLSLPHISLIPRAPATPSPLNHHLPLQQAHSSSQVHANQQPVPTDRINMLLNTSTGCQPALPMMALPFTPQQPVDCVVINKMIYKSQPHHQQFACLGVGNTNCQVPINQPPRLHSTNPPPEYNNPLPTPQPPTKGQNHKPSNDPNYRPSTADLPLGNQIANDAD